MTLTQMVQAQFISSDSTNSSIMTRTRYEELATKSAKNYATSKSGYRLIVTPNFEKSSDMTSEELSEIESYNQPIEFDYVTEQQVSSSSNITTYPLVNGDTIADHMVRNPVSVSFSGEFSLYGNKPTSFSGANDRLTNIEELFEKIQSKGVMCKIATMDRASNSKQRFKVRNNMVLTSITWSEKQSSVAFSFNFNEVMTVDVDEIEVDYTDENLPSITDASTLDFTDTLLDWDSVDMIVINQLYDLGLIEDGFFDTLATWIENICSSGLDAFLAGVTVEIAAGVAAVIVVAGICGGIASIPVVGWLAVAIVATVGFLVGGIYSLWTSYKTKNAEKEYGIQVFKAYEDDRKSQQECERFVSYIGQIHENLEYLEDVISVYGISSNEEQDCMLYIDNNYYIFSFRKNNTMTEDSKTTWSCNIYDVNGTIDVDISDLSSECMTTVTDCTSSNMLFRTQTGGGYWVYLINKDLYTTRNSSYDSSEEMETAVNEVSSDLTTYMIMVAQTNMDNFNETLSELVIDAMKM